MFFIHEFQLKGISRWNERCERESIEDAAPKIPARTEESDFIIFHHTKGVILIEVKTLKEQMTTFRNWPIFHLLKVATNIRDLRLLRDTVIVKWKRIQIWLSRKQSSKERRSAIQEGC